MVEKLNCYECWYERRDASTKEIADRIKQTIIILGTSPGYVVYSSIENGDFGGDHTAEIHGDTIIISWLTRLTGLKKTPEVDRVAMAAVFGGSIERRDWALRIQ